jgi:hypothetical protein
MSLLNFEIMFVRKQALSSEQQNEITCRFFSKESQALLASCYNVSRPRISQIVQKYNEYPKLKAKALEAASLFYELNSKEKPKGASSTHPAAASRVSSGLTVMRAIPLPPQFPPHQLPAFNPSFPGKLLWMSPAELNAPGAIRLLPTGPAITSGPAWTPPLDGSCA